jgi:3,5-epimerase/4-reductase
MDKRTLILGDGYIGKRLQEALRCPLTPRKIENFSDVDGIIDKFKPRTLINCIGHTGANNVDGCELAKDKTLFSNSYVPLLLGEAAYRRRIKLVHLSSGCIYHYAYASRKPIEETLSPDYYDLYYSRSKIYAENALLELSKRADILIVRIRVPLDDRPHPKNILTKLLKFDKVLNVPNSVTYLPDFIKALKHLLKKNKKGIYNIALKGGLYYKDLLGAYNAAGRRHRFSMIRPDELKMNRTNLILSVKKLEQSGFKARTPKEIINECVQNYIKRS